MLFAIIDDFSRAIVHGEFYWDEKLPRLEDALKKAILRHGVPSQFYCDYTEKNTMPKNLLISLLNSGF